MVVELTGSHLLALANGESVVLGDVIVRPGDGGVSGAPMIPVRSKPKAASNPRVSANGGRPVDPNDLPVIRWVKFPNPCGQCHMPVGRGTAARWNPETKTLYCNACKPLPEQAVTA